jgi:hypothetical protein
MRAYRNSNCWRLAGIASAWLLLISPVAADFSVSEINARLESGKLSLTGNLDLSLNSRVEEAVSKGIPLDVDIELRLYRTRPVIWAKQLSEWKLRKQIRYHALSGQYLVSETRDGAEVLENFTSLQQALSQMGNLGDRMFEINARMAPDDSLIVDARVSLDIETLPAPLRPVAYTSLDWRLNSGWTSWKVQR